MLASKFSNVLQKWPNSFMHHDLINTKTNQPICNVTQIRVRYSKKPFNNDSSGHKNYLPEEDWEDIGQGPPIGNVILQDTPLLVNVKGILICNSDETMLKALVVVIQGIR